MTPEEQDRMRSISTTNHALRLKLQAAEKENEQIAVLAKAVDEFRSMYFAAQEKLTKALLILEKLGALNEIQTKPAPEREQENDARTRQAIRGFER